MELEGKSVEKLQKDEIINTTSRTSSVSRASDNIRVFTKFQRLSDAEISSNWRKEKSKTFAEMGLDEQGEFIFTQISTDFFDWVKGKDLPNLRINEHTLNYLFQVGGDNPSVRSFNLNIKELASVPKVISDKCMDFEKSERAALHRQLVWDVSFEKAKPRLTAFGKHHPRQRKSWSKNIKDNWFCPGAVSQEMICGVALWNDLMSSRVLKSYCRWLLNNPQYKKPEFLVESGQLKSGDTVEFNEEAIDEKDLIFLANTFIEEDLAFRATLPNYPEIQFIYNELGEFEIE